MKLLKSIAFLNVSDVMPYKSEFKQHKNVQYEIWRTTHFEKKIYIIEVTAIFTVKHSKKNLIYKNSAFKG